MIRPLNFTFTLEEGMTESEIQSLWRETQQSQWAMDKFLAGEVTEQEMTDILSSCNVDLLQTQNTLENNLIYLGVM